MLLRYYCLFSSELGWGNVGLLLLCCIYLRAVQQQDHACVCRGGIRRIWMTGSVRGECQLEDLPGSSMVQTRFSWANFIFLWQEPLPQCQCDSKYLYPLWNWLFWPWGWCICWPSLFNTCSASKELLAGLRAERSSLAVVCWKMKCAHPRRKHHFRNFRFLHHPPPSEPSF